MNKDELRPSWDEYFLAMAHLVATRATCDRKLVGAVLVDDRNRVVATGYNGAPHGALHCDDEGHQLVAVNGRDTCIRAIHAESNALDYAGKEARGCTLYVTIIPCWECAKRVVQAGITRVVYKGYYASRNTELVEELLMRASITLVQLERDTDNERILAL